MMDRPGPDEYHEFYATYISKVPDGEITKTLASQALGTVDLLTGLGLAQELFRYEDGKWSLREAVGHVIDAERLFTFRALHIARGDQAPLPGMDQEVWVAHANAHQRPLAELLSEFQRVRSVTMAQFRALDEEAWLRRGVASGREFSVRALAWMVAGHELHHRQIFRDRYLTSEAI